MLSGQSYLTYSTAKGRWSRFGSYYAMFPLEFAEQAILLYSKPKQTVIDPFCGRGTTPFVAMVHGRNAIACDINPVAWLYTKAKTDPYPDKETVKKRILQIKEAVTTDDYVPDNEFQELAFCKPVLGYINSARRELDWRECHLDRTVAALLVHHLHDKKGAGLSNQLRHSRAMSPDYCIRWWKKNGFKTPPDIAPDQFLINRVIWRYAKGVPRSSKIQAPIIALGPAANVLPETDSPATLVVTSPPYSNVTNYQTNNWLRLWALGVGPSLPKWNQDQKFICQKEYRKMLKGSLSTTLERTHADTVWYIRSDKRPRTKDIITSVMKDLLPNHRLYELSAPYNKRTQTALYGDDEPKPGEIDLLYMPPRRKRKTFTLKFDPA